MSSLKRTFMKTKMLSAFAFAALSIPSYAQIYLQDYTTLHKDPYDNQMVVQDAIYRDDNEGAYYIAQQLRPIGDYQSYLGITKCDKDMNLISTWEYFNESANYNIKTETIDEMYGYDALILVGQYDDHNGINEPFVMSVDKFSGTVNWFKFFPGLILTSLEAEKDFVIVTGSRPLPNNDGIFSYSASAAIIMRLDKSGNLDWEREFEDDKYASSGYGPKFVYNTLNDVKRIDDKYFVAVGSTNEWIYKENPDNHWDADGLIVMIDYKGNINYAIFLGNSLPMDPNGQAHIQYELMDHLTFDPEDKTVVIAGERLEHEQKEVSDAYPTPQSWGLWVTKFDPYSASVIWMNRYQFKDDFYRLSDPEIEHDTKAQYGISYNFDKYNTMVMKLKNSGSVIYHRFHFVSGMDDKRWLNDIVKAFEYNNMTVVGQVTPIICAIDPSYGWNIQAFDNIQQKCEMYEYKIEPKEVKYEMEKVKYREYKVAIKEVKLKPEEIKLENKIICKKVEIGLKSSPSGDDITTKVSHDIDRGVISIQVQQTALQGNTASADFKGILYNALGQKILETEKFSNNYQLNVSQLATGIYYLHVTNGSFQQAHTVFVR